MTLGNTILKYRKELGITQDALAQKLEVTNQAVSKWESDQCCPDISLLPRLADIFGITIDELFGREAPAKAETVIHDLPWKDDGNLRGVLYMGRKLLGHGVGGKVQLFFNGRVDKNVYCDFSLVCGDVGGDADAGGNIQCGNVGGDVDAGGNVECRDVEGDVDAGGNVECGKVEGDVDAGNSVTCNDVGGSVDAGNNVTCREVGDCVDAGSSVECGAVNGSVDAGGNVTCQNVAGDIDAGCDVRCTSVGGSIDAGGNVILGK